MPAFPKGEEIEQIELHSLHLRDGLHISTALLSDAEKARVAAFRSRDAARLFIAGRLLCRSIIGRMVGCAPQALTISLTPHGRPYLPDHADIDFNLSHTTDRVALAVCRGGRVGIDIEQPDRISETEALEIMPFILCERELDDIQRQPPEQRHRTFLSYWVRKEAVLKCRGRGFLDDPRGIALEPANTTENMLNRAFNEANFIRFGSCRSENAPNFLWAVAASQMLSEPVWQQHPDVGNLIEGRLKLK